MQIHRWNARKIVPQYIYIYIYINFELIIGLGGFNDSI